MTNFHGMKIGLTGHNKKLTHAHHTDFPHLLLLSIIDDARFISTVDLSRVEIYIHNKSYFVLLYILNRYINIYNDFQVQIHNDIHNHIKYIQILNM